HGDAAGSRLRCQFAGGLAARTPGQGGGLHDAATDDDRHCDAFDPVRDGPALATGAGRRWGNVAVAVAVAGAVSRPAARHGGRVLQPPLGHVAKFVPGFGFAAPARPGAGPLRPRVPAGSTTTAA